MSTAASPDPTRAYGPCWACLALALALLVAVIASFVYLAGVEGGDAIAKATGTEFFSVPIELGPSGAEKAIDVVGSANDHEKKLLQACYDGLKGNISKGVEFAQNPPAK